MTAKLFADVLFYLSPSLPPQKRDPIRTLLLFNGATEAESIGDVTHVITDSHRFEGWQAFERLQREREREGRETGWAVTVTWVERSLLLGKLQPPQSYPPDPAMIFSGVVACATELPTHDLEVLSAGILALGGQWRTGLTKEVTHLFALSTTSPKYTTALHFQEQTRVKVVLPHWFDDSVRLGMCDLQTEPYEWPDPPLLRGNDQDRTVSKVKKATAVEHDPLKRSLYATAVKYTPSSPAAPFAMVPPSSSAATLVQQDGEADGIRETVWQGRKILLARNLRLVGGRREAVEIGIRRAGGKVVRWEGDETDDDNDLDEEKPQAAAAQTNTEPPATKAGAERGRRERDRREAQAVEHCDVFITRWREGRAYVAAFTTHKTIGTLAWLYHVQCTGVIARPLDQLLHFPIPRKAIEGFRGHEITVTNYTGEAREYLKRLITTMGAVFTPSMSGHNTVLIAATKSSTKAQKALSWSIPVVNHTWLEDCFVQWRNLTPATEKYLTFPVGVDFAAALGERGLSAGGLSAPSAATGIAVKGHIEEEVDDLAEQYVAEDEVDATAHAEVGAGLDDEPGVGDPPRGTGASANEVQALFDGGDDAGVEVDRDGDIQMDVEGEVNEEEEPPMPPVRKQKQKLKEKGKGRSATGRQVDSGTEDEQGKEVEEDDNDDGGRAAQTRRRSAKSSAPSKGKEQEEEEDDDEPTVFVSSGKGRKTATTAPLRTTPAAAKPKPKPKPKAQTRNSLPIAPTPSTKPAQSPALTKSQTKGKGRGKGAAPPPPPAEEASSTSDSDDEVEVVQFIRPRKKTVVADEGVSDYDAGVKAGADDREGTQKEKDSTKGVVKGEKPKPKPSLLNKPKGDSRTRVRKSISTPSGSKATGSGAGKIKRSKTEVESEEDGEEEKEEEEEEEEEERNADVEEEEEEEVTQEEEEVTQTHTKSKGKGKAKAASAATPARRTIRSTKAATITKRAQRPPTSDSDNQEQEDEPENEGTTDTETLDEAPTASGSKTKPRSKQAPKPTPTTSVQRVMSVLLPTLQLSAGKKKKKASKDDDDDAGDRKARGKGKGRASNAEVTDDEDEDEEGEGEVLHRKQTKPARNKLAKSNSVHVSSNEKQQEISEGVIISKPRWSLGERKAGPSAPTPSFKQARSLPKQSGSKVHPQSPSEDESDDAPMNMDVDDTPSQPSSSRVPTAETPAPPSRQRGAALRATAKLRDEIMPDLVNFEQQMRKARSRKSGGGGMADFVVEGDTPAPPEKEGLGKRKKRDSDVKSRGDERDPDEGDENKDEGHEENGGRKNTKKRRISGDHQDDGKQLSTSVGAKKKQTGKENKNVRGEEVGSSGGRPIRVMTTQVSLPEDVVKALIKLGVTFTTRPAECTHLLASGLVRTEKFLCALAVVPCILNENWALDSAKAKKLLPENDYVLKDKEGELKYQISLTTALERAKKNNGKLLAGKTFYITPKVQAGIGLLKTVIMACGGQVAQTRNPTVRILKASQNRYLISRQEDITIWRSISENGFPVYSQELILMGALRQQIEWDNRVYRVDES